MYVSLTWSLSQDNKRKDFVEVGRLLVFWHGHTTANCSPHCDDPADGILVHVCGSIVWYVVSDVDAGRGTGGLGLLCLSCMTLRTSSSRPRRQPSMPRSIIECVDVMLTFCSISSSVSLSSSPLLLFSCCHASSSSLGWSCAMWATSRWVSPSTTLGHSCSTWSCWVPCRCFTCSGSARSLSW